MNNYEKARDIVLIVEDTHENHEILEIFLSDINVRCDHAYDGMEAVTLCSTTPPDYYSLILMDINLPHMNGIKTTEKLKSMGITSPVMAVTATGKNDECMNNAQDLFCFTLFKPFNYSDFYTAISPYIKGSSAFSLAPEKSTDNDTNDGLSNDNVCDINEGISNMGGNMKLFVKHFNNFKRNNVDLHDRLKGLVEDEEYTNAAMLCHSIKGLAGMLALTDLCTHIIELEAFLKDAAEAITDDPHHSCNNLSEDLNSISDALLNINTDIRAVCKIQF